MNLTPDLTFLDQTKPDLEFSGSNFMWKLCCSDHEYDLQILMENTQKTPDLHVNTQKNVRIKQV